MPEPQRPLPPRDYSLEDSMLKLRAVGDLVGQAHDLGCVDRDGLGLLLAELAYELRVLAHEHAARAAGRQPA